MKYNKFNFTVILSVLVFAVWLNCALLLGVGYGGGPLVANAEGLKAGKQVVNVAVNVLFSDSEKDDVSDSLANEVFNTSDTGLKNYIYVNSEGNVDVQTQFVATVTLDKSSDYFMPAFEYDKLLKKYVEINPEGYDNRYYLEGEVSSPNVGKPSVGYVDREQQFLRCVLQKLDHIKLPDNVDGDGNQFIDSLTFIVGDPIIFDNTDEHLWGSVFWPHMGNFYYGDERGLSAYYLPDGFSIENFSEVYFDGKVPYYYFIVPESSFSSGRNTVTSVVCHEFMHILGSADYYHYDDAEISPVGEFDIMGQTAEPPQLSLSYLRFKMGWLEEGEDILAVEESGVYTLNSVESQAISRKNGVKAYKIVLSDYYKTGECFYVEFRDNLVTPYGEGLLDRGLIIYRVNEDNAFIGPDGNKGSYDYGNMYGEDEIYVYRYWKGGLFGSEYSPREDVSLNGICYANISDKVGYTSYGSAYYKGRNVIDYSDGTDSGISIKFLSFEDDGSVKFQITIPEEDGEIGDLSAYTGVYVDRLDRKYLKWDSLARKGDAYILISDKKLEGVTAEELISGQTGLVKKIPVSFKKYVLPKSNQERYVYFTVSRQGESSEVLEFYIDGVSDVYDQLKLIVVLMVVGWVLTATGVGALIFILKRKHKQKLMEETDE